MKALVNQPGSVGSHGQATAPVTLKNCLWHRRESGYNGVCAVRIVLALSASAPQQVSCLCALPSASRLITC